MTGDAAERLEGEVRNWNETGKLSDTVAVPFSGTYSRSIYKRKGSSYNGSSVIVMK